MHAIELWLVDKTSVCVSSLSCVFVSPRKISQRKNRDCKHASPLDVKQTTDEQHMLNCWSILCPKPSLCPTEQPDTILRWLQLTSGLHPRDTVHASSHRIYLSTIGGEVFGNFILGSFCMRPRRLPPSTNDLMSNCDTTVFVSDRSLFAGCFSFCFSGVAGSQLHALNSRSVACHLDRLITDFPPCGRSGHGTGTHGRRQAGRPPPPVRYRESSPFNLLS